MKMFLRRFAADYGMIFVLLLLCTFFSFVTLSMQFPTGTEGGATLARQIVEQLGTTDTSVVILASSSGPDVEFTAAAQTQLESAGVNVAAVVNGDPPQVRETLEKLVAAGTKVDALACNETAARWNLVENVADRFPQLGAPQIVVPRPYRYPNFLKPQNLANVASQSSVFAIMAIGMTMVIITAGIDLSVGSLVAMSAVVTALVMREYFGGPNAGVTGMAVGAVCGILACTSLGISTGLFVTQCGITPFVVTLAMMAVARGLAQIMAKGQSVYEIPADRFSWLANGAPLGVPNAVVMMIVFYVIAHILMTQTTLGRYIYAVGGNTEAARLSGVPVNRVLMFVYAICGALAGLGGVIEASRLGSGSPLYGNMYELYVIAAVVVGGTSLAGGEGKILNTLIGALIIGVIRNGMNLMNVESYTQGVVMGVLILTAVLIDTAKRRGWRVFFVLVRLMRKLLPV